MNKKHIIIEAAINEDGKILLYPDRYTRIDRPDLYETYEVIEGKTARVVIVSDDRIDKPECRRLAIAYMTGRYSHWAFSLTDEKPQWRRVK